MVRLVEYSESSDDDHDVHSDGSQWSSYGEIPLSPTDSFSCPMPSPESDEEDDDDYAPSETSLGDAGSVTSSVDTDDLDPDNDLDMQQSDSKMDTLDGTEQDEVIDLPQRAKNNGVFYAWKDLQAAFEDNPFKRRNVQIEEADEEEQTEDEATETPNLFDVEAGQWRFHAGVADKRPSRRRTSTAPCRPTGVSPRFSTLFTGEKRTAPSTTATDFSMNDSQKHHEDKSAFNFPSVEIPAFSNQQKTAPKTPDFTFGTTAFSDDAPMRSPSPQHTPVESGFTMGQSGKPPKPYTFAGQGVDKLSFKTPPPVKIVDDGDDTSMRSASPQVKPANGEFLFGQAYKNRNPFTRQNSNDSIHANESTESAHGANVPTSGTSGGSLDSAKVSAFFSTGVAGPKQHLDRRKKKNSLGAAFTPPTSSTNSSPFGVSSSMPTFGSSPFQAAPATRVGSNTTAAAPFGSTQARASTTAMPSKQPSTDNTSGSYVFGSTEGNPFQTPAASPFQTGIFGSKSSSTTANTDASGQLLFGNGTSRHPFQFGETKPDLQPGASASGYQDGNASTPTSDGFQIGSSNTKKSSRVRPRKSGMFTHKNSPRKDAKIGSFEPEPSPGLAPSSPATPSPFGMHNRRSRKNARLRRHGRSPPADPFVTPTFQSHATSSPFVSAPTVRPTVKAATPSTNPFGFPTQQSQPGDPKPSHRPVPNEARPQKETTRPALAGSRRILRAALRNVGDRARSVPLTTSSGHVEGDTEMDSEDERDWEELKRLGGVAHCSRKYHEAAEYYRQSIEVLDSLLYHDAIEDSSEIRTDKAKLHANRAASLMMLMQITEAQQECRRSIEVDATYARAYLRLGRIQVLLGDTGHAQANLDTARQLMEGRGGEIRAGDQADHASLTKMEDTIKKLTVLQGEIKWYVDAGDYKQALVHTDSALALAPSSRKLQVQKGQILLGQREFDQLVEFCDSIIEKQQRSQRKMPSPASGDGMNVKTLRRQTVEKITVVGIDLGLLWATSLHYQNKVDDAVRILNALEVVAPCSSHVIQLKRQWQDMKQLKHNGNERFKRGEYQEAVRFYSEAVLIDPQHQEFCAVIYCNRAAAQMGLARYHTAILDCNEALQRKSTYPRALLRRARCHVALEMFHEAVKDFDRYLREQPRDVSVDGTADVRRERNEAKAAIAKAREQARQREATKKRAEREQRQRRQRRWEEPSWNDSTFNENFRRNTGSNGYGGHQSSGAGSRASFMAPKTQRRTHYDVLGIEKAATTDQIKKAYRKLALVYHPDKAKTSTHADLFKEMTAAYNVLSDESARSKYDRELIYNRFGNFYEN
ncbi:DnaJ domain [Phytophthora infestans]|uniref:DnaJ domain n=1 Tax=Phytophthora infestans TaxID=4787 RepID=A0A833ST44_PHYIN|nr:DnaJ domain [Phytophthora infestans]KAI9990776.1 hypothetical protein PInf_018341 [Phytophthora infestans]